uniref:Ig-like domain-containing protein n=1 Tax=Knipowitschia caucasica TaxID=637954 RepID=A0AAV2MR49_KNICA
MLTALAPPVHLSGDRLGWTLLVCVVSDLQRGHIEVVWKPSRHYIPESSFTSVIVNDRHQSHSPVSIITVATNDWPGFRCSANHKRRPKIPKRRRVNPSSNEETRCFDEMEIDYANTVVVLMLRLLLLKIVAFNVLLTIYSVIKW